MNGKGYRKLKELQQSQNLIQIEAGATERLPNCCVHCAAPVSGHTKNYVNGRVERPKETAMNRVLFSSMLVFFLFKVCELGFYLFSPLRGRFKSKNPSVYYVPLCASFNWGARHPDDRRAIGEQSGDLEGETVL
jgi:hypothetical protein